VISGGGYPPVALHRNGARVPSMKTRLRSDVTSVSTPSGVVDTPPAINTDSIGAKGNARSEVLYCVALSFIHGVVL